MSLALVSMFVYAIKSVLTSKQEELIAAMLETPKIAQAALKAGIPHQTARRWVKLPAFQDAYKAAQRDLFDRALNGLMLKVDKAIETIGQVMDDLEAPANARLRAAQIILEQAIQVHKMSELEAKYVELEQFIKSAGMGK